MRKVSAWVLAVGLALPGASALADTQALSFTGGSYSISPDGSTINTVGWTFNLASDIMLTQLGFYDAGVGGVGEVGDGLLASHEVGIWTDDGSLVASATVTTLDTLSNGFRWTDVATPVLMTTGDYRIGALVREADGDYYYSGAEAINTASPVTFKGAAYAGNIGVAAFTMGPGTAAYSLGELAFPDEVQAGVNGRFGPNFQFVSAVPEPSTVLLMLGGLVAVAGVARRRRRMG